MDSPGGTAIQTIIMKTFICILSLLATITLNAQPAQPVGSVQPMTGSPVVPLQPVPQRSIVTTPAPMTNSVPPVRNGFVPPMNGSPVSPMTNRFSEPMTRPSTLTP
jgi:hypothetical protein